MSTSTGCASERPVAPPIFTAMGVRQQAPCLRMAADQ
jgi:hypothetical protein